MRTISSGFFSFIPSQIQGKASSWGNSQLCGSPRGAAGPDPSLWNSACPGLVWDPPVPQIPIPAPFPRDKSITRSLPGGVSSAAIPPGFPLSPSWGAGMEFCGSSPVISVIFVLSEPLLQGFHPRLPRPNPTGKSKIPSKLHPDPSSAQGMWGWIHTGSEINPHRSHFRSTQDPR